MMPNWIARLVGRNVHKHGRITLMDFIGQSGGSIRPCYLCGELCLKREMEWIPTDGMCSDLVCVKCADEVFP